MEGATRLSPFAHEPSEATVIRVTTPAVAAAGEAIGNTAAFDVAPESTTVTVALPGVAIREAETVAAKSVLSPNCVGRGFPLQLTTAELVKPVPFTRRVNDPWPAIA